MRQTRTVGNGCGIWKQNLVGPEALARKSLAKKYRVLIDEFEKYVDLSPLYVARNLALPKRSRKRAKDDPVPSI